MYETPRQQLLDCFNQALMAIHGQQSVARALENHPLCEQPCVVVAIGKAAQAMAQGAEQQLADNLKHGLLITKHQHSEPGQLSDAWHCHEAAHPVPDQSSLQSGQHLLDFLQTHASLPVLFLISGGASSLVEVLPAHISLEQWQQLNSWLLSSGMDIGRMNVIRQAVSSIKGGKLHDYLQEREVHGLMISDVPGDHLHTIGSGLLHADPEPQPIPHGDLPPWLSALIRQHASGGDTSSGQLASQQIIASNRLAMQAAGDCMQGHGYKVVLHDQPLEGDATCMARQVSEYLKHAASPGVHIWGGETTMVLPDNPGQGGRNQHFALVAAKEIAGNNQICLLAAGTDGTDGPTEDAGAIVDGQTVARGSLSGLDIDTCLEQADSGHFLQASGDLLYTGPTGSNVMDLVIAIKAK